MKPDFLYAFDKVLKTIKSCQTLSQWVRARRLRDLFKEMYEVEYHDPNKNIYFVDLSTWSDIMLDKITSNSNNTVN